MSKKIKKDTVKKKSGQTLVEYVLIVFVIMGIYAVLNRTILKGIGKLWKQLTIEVASACPDCQRPPELE